MTSESNADLSGESPVADGGDVRQDPSIWVEAKIAATPASSSEDASEETGADAGLDVTVFEPEPEAVCEADTGAEIEPEQEEDAPKEEATTLPAEPPEQETPSGAPEPDASTVETQEENAPGKRSDETVYEVMAELDEVENLDETVEAGETDAEDSRPEQNTGETATAPSAPAAANEGESTAILPGIPHMTTAMWLTGKKQKREERAGESAPESPAAVSDPAQSAAPPPVEPPESAALTAKTPSSDVYQLDDFFTSHDDYRELRSTLFLRSLATGKKTEA